MSSNHRSAGQRSELVGDLVAASSFPGMQGSWGAQKNTTAQHSAGDHYESDPALVRPIKSLVEVGASPRHWLGDVCLLLVIGSKGLGFIGLLVAGPGACFPEGSLAWLCWEPGFPQKFE